MKTNELIILYNLPIEEFIQIRSTIKISFRRLRRRIEKQLDLNLLANFHAKELAYSFRKLTSNLTKFLYTYD